MTARNIWITPNQSRAARALLGNLSTEEVRRVADLGANTITRFEMGRHNLNLTSLEKLVAAYQKLGIDFPDQNTVRKVA